MSPLHHGTPVSPAHPPWPLTPGGQTVQRFVPAAICLHWSSSTFLWLEAASAAWELLHIMFILIRPHVNRRIVVTQHVVVTRNSGRFISGSAQGLKCEKDVKILTDLWRSRENLLWDFLVSLLSWRMWLHFTEFLWTREVHGTFGAVMGLEPKQIQFRSGSSKRLKDSVHFSTFSWNRDSEGETGSGVRMSGGGPAALPLYPMKDLYWLLF